MNQAQKKEIQKLITSGKTEKAISKLLKMDLSESQKQEVRMISAQFSDLQKDIRTRVVSFENETIRKNQITQSLLEIISTENPSSNVQEQNSNPTKKFWKQFGFVIGIIGSIASIIGLVYTFYPSESEPLQLTIFVADKDQNVVLENEGELNIALGNRSMNKKIGENGRTNFGEIANQLKGDSITIGFKADGWKLASTNKFKFTGKPIHLEIRPDESLGVIKGVVRSRDGQEFIGGAMIRINSDTLIYSDDFGNFKIVLPENMRVKKKTDAYKLMIFKEGYKTTSEQYFPMGQIEIRLEKQ